MKSNWIHCKIFGFSEQTHHFPREQDWEGAGVAYGCPTGWAQLGSLAALGAVAGDLSPRPVGWPDFFSGSQPEMASSSGKGRNSSRKN